jgi:hypothetical protein
MTTASRLRRLLIAGTVLGCLALLGLLGWRVWTDLTYDDVEEKRQGRLIVDRLREGDSREGIYWIPGKGHVTIVVYGETDPDAQRALIKKFGLMKEAREVTMRVTIQFYEREVWIESPKNAKGIWGERRGAEHLIASVEL